MKLKELSVFWKFRDVGAVNRPTFDFEVDVYSEEHSDIAKQDEKTIKVVPIIHVEVHFPMNSDLYELFNSVVQEVEEEEYFEGEDNSIQCCDITK